jgi:hypothetical protein
MMSDPWPPPEIQDAFRRLPAGSSKSLGLDSFIEQFDNPILFLGDPEEYPSSEGFYLTFLKGKPYSTATAEIVCCSGDNTIQTAHAGRGSPFFKNHQPGEITFRKIILLEQRKEA